MPKKLSPSMQDYLETILDLSATEDEVRITDIANRLNISKASTNQAIGGLVKRGMVTHPHYGPVTLTEKGRLEAEKIRYRHDVLKKLLTDVMKVDPEVAERDACLMEHTISQETLTKLVSFMESYTAGKEETEMAEKAGSTASIEITENAESTESTYTKLSDLMVGTKGIIRKIVSGGSIKKRILEMGLTVGTTVEVKGVAPMGDPIDVLVKGYHLSLRKKEASLVLVEVI